MKKKIDCFLFLDGFDVLKLRLAELNKHIDTFVLVESPYNFHGDPKPLYFKENPITGYPIKHVVIENIRHYDVGVHAELTQDNMIGIIQEGFREGTKDFDASDFCYLGDFDEIVRPSKLLAGPHDETVGFMMDWYLYWLNCKVNIPLEGTCRHRLGWVDDFWSGISYRYAAIANKNLIPNAGWHFSSFGGIDFVMQKLAGFPAAHFREMKREEVEKMILAGTDIHNEALGRRTIGMGPLSDDLPKAFLKNPKAWTNLIHPDYRE